MAIINLVIDFVRNGCMYNWSKYRLRTFTSGFDSDISQDEYFTFNTILNFSLWLFFTGSKWIEFAPLMFKSKLNLPPSWLRIFKLIYWIANFILSNLKYFFSAQMKAEWKYYDGWKSTWNWSIPYLFPFIFYFQSLFCTSHHDFCSRKFECF